VAIRSLPVVFSHSVRPLRSARVSARA